MALGLTTRKERSMAVPRIQRLTLSLIVATLLAGALWMLANSRPAPASADSGALFATPSGSGTACSQAAACTLQTAGAQAQAGDVVYLAAGSYHGVDAGAVVTVTRGYTLYGGWDGAAAGPVARGPAAHPSVLDGENVQRGLYIDGMFTAGVDGLTITSGKAEQGGRIFVRHATVLIRNNVITACQTVTFTTWAYGAGAGICLHSAGSRLDCRQPDCQQHIGVRRWHL
jgi:hypothetical protein